MSAICGIITLNSKENFKQSGSKMMDLLNNFNFDRSHTFCSAEVFMGCGLRCVTPESINEILPKQDTESKLVITADAIIDNRSELLVQFKIERKLWYKVTDSDLILMAYNMWHQDCPKYLLGDYAFAIWDEELKELFCARDHVGTRTIYYSFSEDTFSFCTILEPLLKKKAILSEKWLTDFLALAGVSHVFECGETVYQGIYEIAPATSLVFSSKGIKKATFWDPFQEIKPLKFDTDKEYIDAFNEVLFEAVHCRLRTMGEVGSFLSGGLDSTAVACVAAKKLSEENKTLHSFTSIPVKGFYTEHPKHVVYDESDDVKIVSSAYNNIRTNFCEFQNKNALSDIEENFGVLEQPYKIFRNLYWLKGIFKEASEKNCRVILGGQYGNFTISAGDFETRAFTLLKEGRFITLRREILELSKFTKIPVLKVFYRLRNVFLPYNLRKLYHIIKKDYDPFKHVLINKSLLKKWDVKHRFKIKRKNEPIKRYYNLKENFKFSLRQENFSHIGTIMTKLSLKYGIISRDPTIDKRVIEFCLRLPGDQFVRDGRQRLLVRHAMEGIVPDEIRLNYSKRGVQSYDWIKRLEPQWKAIYIEAEHIIGDQVSGKYIDVDKLSNILNDLKKNPNKRDDSKVQMLILAIIFSRFLKNIEG